MNRRDFLRGTSFAALTCALPSRGAQPGAQTGADADSPGRVLTGHQWRTLAAVQDHLFPSEPAAPGSGDIRATAYLDGVLADPDLDPETRTFVLSGVGWLDDLAQEGHGCAFADLEPAPREERWSGWRRACPASGSAASSSPSPRAATPARKG